MDDEHSKILIGIRLVLEWLYFKSKLLEVNLFLQFKSMFHHHPNKIILRRKFEEYSWIKQDAVSMEDRVPVFYSNLQQLKIPSILKDRNIEIGINGNEIADKLIKKATKRVI
ncbi:Protein THO1 [Vespula maculifrons]|uniref:Protein THO1 n=1 Tax=Vespula maculifrons TaxID=7453 RepID=A0ABD2CRQ4_VESMC